MSHLSRTGQQKNSASMITVEMGLEPMILRKRDLTTRPPRSNQFEIIVSQTVKGEFYWEVLKRLLARIRRVRPHLKQTGSWFLFHNNVRPHTARLVKRFLAQHWITGLSTHRIPQTMSPPDFFMFPKLKEALKGRRFTDITHIQASVTWVLKAVPVEEFSRAYDDLYTRCQRFILSNCQG
ncbi:hypothetical protein AVEN_87114-1 [Araneus ventricosus]|uniref:Mariner Mos1 transposase n=1 Tax=Araneus ventricosus TaxID=182803 RepID=A0A4Y2HKE8_ARAVE|nr:hypothetical protein AVEN_87114-1 [Araneus ventricosus]